MIATTTTRGIPRPRGIEACRPYDCHGLGSSHFARRYFENRCCFLFLQVLRCFSSLGLLPHPYEFRARSWDMTPRWFPHSDIAGSLPAYGSPTLIAVCHVFHRFRLPRHPSYALSSLVIELIRTSKDIVCNCQRSGGREGSLPQIGGGERDRTVDLVVANHALSQLSYTPEKMVGLGRFELPTSRLSGVRSEPTEL